MNFRRLLPILLAGVAVLTGCDHHSTANPPGSPALEIDPIYGHLLHAQPKLPTLKVRLDDQELTAEIARRPVEIATGMMFRTNMLDSEGMLFVFPDAAPRSFYMRNCTVPLSGAYISPNGEILEIIQMKPHDETGIPSQSSRVQFVLEVPQGWFERHHIELGTIVRTERGSLQETFFGPN